MWFKNKPIKHEHIETKTQKCSKCNWINEVFYKATWWPYHMAYCPECGSFEHLNYYNCTLLVPGTLGRNFEITMNEISLQENI